MIQGDLFGQAAPVRESYRREPYDLDVPMCMDCRFARDDPLFTMRCTLLKRDVSAIGICDAHEFRSGEEKRAWREWAEQTKREQTGRKA